MKFSLLNLALRLNHTDVIARLQEILRQDGTKRIILIAMEKKEINSAPCGHRNTTIYCASIFCNMECFSMRGKMK